MGDIERVTQHDVKAVEYFLKRRLTEIAPASEDKGLAEPSTSAARPRTSTTSPTR